MRNLTDVVSALCPPAVAAWALATTDRTHVVNARKVWADIRAQHGFSRVDTPLLTPPSANAKLAKGATPAYGITLQHYVTNLGAVGGHKRLVVNACPWAGDCTKVCVLDNGNGTYDSVQRARKAKTQLLATEPAAFFVLLGDEIRRAVKRHGAILVRPNVNSDVTWQTIAPALVDGSVFGDAVKFYGYSKDVSVLATDGWITPHYRVAYSLSEQSPGWGSVLRFLARGGSVAAVTNRSKTTPVAQWAVASAPVADADPSDEWLFQSGVIGDLSAKGKARSLVGKSDFVLSVY
jgi:hypothetical protein